MMTIDEMNQIKSELRLTYQKICLESGVPIGTVQKVLGGITKNPRMDTLRELENTFLRLQANAKASENNSSHKKDIVGSRIRESFSYESSRQNSPRGNTSTKKSVSHVYTLKERESFPESRRTEIIDGVLYDMAAPTPVHQDIAKEICRQIDDCIHRHHSECRSYLAPTDVCLDCDEYTVIQPDVFVVCDRKKITRKNIQGAPDFI